MIRNPIIAANWKMNMTPTETEKFLNVFLKELPTSNLRDVVIAPPFVSLAKAADMLMQADSVKLSAQNMSQEASGAFTGEISAAMLLDLGCRYVILGHSERRSLYGEDDVVINKKVHAALAAGLIPILCIGESLGQRDGGQLESVLSTQLEGSLANVSTDAAKGIIIAYEPVWAIGTGRTASPEQAQETQAYVRSVLSRLYGAAASEVIRIQYGGSVKPGNAAELISQPDIDGFLVGGASLDPVSFAEIVRAGCC